MSDEGKPNEKDELDDDEYDGMDIDEDIQQQPRRSKRKSKPTRNRYHRFDPED